MKLDVKIRSRKKKLFPPVFDFVLYTLMTLLTASFLYPFIYVLSVSVSDSYAVAQNSVRLLPIGFDIKAYQHVLRDDTIFRAYMNTVLYSAIGTIITLVLTCLAAYPMAMKNLYGKPVIIVFFAIPMFFGGGLIPFYLLIRDLHILNTIWAIVVPGAVGMWNIVIVRTYFQTIPESIQESAHMDGASHWRVLLQLIIPLSKPVIAVMIMFRAVGLWNEFFAPLMFLSGTEKMPLQVVLRTLIVSRNTSQQSIMTNTAASTEVDPFGLRQKIKMAAVIVSIGPIIAVYPFLQKYFVKGVMIGAIKA